MHGFFLTFELNLRQVCRAGRDTLKKPPRVPIGIAPRFCSLQFISSATASTLANALSKPATLR